MDEIREDIVNAEVEAGNLPENGSASPDEQRSVQSDGYIQPHEEENPREYTTLQTVFAWVCWLLGYLLCRIVPVVLDPLGGFLFIIALFAVTTVFLKRQGAKFQKTAVSAVCATLIVSVALVLSSNGLLHQVSFWFSLLTYVYFVYSAMGNNLQKGFSDYILADCFKAVFVLPFCSFGHMFKAMFNGRTGKSGKVFGKTLLGIAIAFIPTVVVIVLLSYDKDFTKLLIDIFDFGSTEVLSHILCIGFGIPIGMYVFGLFLSSVDGNKAEFMDVPTLDKVSNEFKKMPSVTAFAAALPLLLVYVVFFISQWKYYVSGFLGVLPDEGSYADYAREGFFQLVTVSVINFVMIVVLSFFMKRNNQGKSLLLKVLSVVYSVFTLVLMSTAMAKMVMYIDCYGLTPKRVYASWFMIVLAMVFILVIIKQFINKFKVIIASIGVCVVLFCALSLSNVDGLIAKYNVDRYLDGSLKTVDVEALYDLGDSAVPEMVRLSEELDKQLGTDISKAIDENNKLNSYLNSKEWVYNSLVLHIRQSADRIKTENDSIFAFTVQRYRAEKSLDSIGAFD